MLNFHMHPACFAALEKLGKVQMSSELSISAEHGHGWPECLRRGCLPAGCWRGS